MGQSDLGMTGAFRQGYNHKRSGDGVGTTQQKQAKEHKAMIESLQKGDKIITNGGIICEVVKSEEDFIKVKLNDEVIVKVSREYVSKKLDA